MSDGVAAFFDLDLTLIDVNSGRLWARSELREKRISIRQFAWAAIWAALYRLSLVDIKRALEQAVEHYRGVREEDLDLRTREWFAREVAGRARPKALEAVEEHRSRGHRLVILTSSTSYEATVACETWGFDDWLANRFPATDEGRLRGTIEQPVCYGPGKVTRAEAWADERGYDLDRSFFYSDSHTDLPMLERVGEPRVVCPDPRLRRVARRRGWPILEW